MSHYRLGNKIDPSHNTIAVVGVGGTGSFAAEGIARLLGESPQPRLLLVDGDLVEERNLGRQSYYPEDLGRPKAQALAERLARRHRRPVGYYSNPLVAGDSGQNLLARCALVVGCVDNAPTRAAIADLVQLSQWWLDAGNGSEFGQVLVGNATRERLRSTWAFYPRVGLCQLLPLPTVVRPELLVPAPRRQSCAEAVEAGEQGPTINQFMAALVVEAVRRFLEGRLTWWQAHVDLDAGTLRTVSPTPEAVSRLTRLRVRTLVKEPDGP